MQVSVKLAKTPISVSRPKKPPASLPKPLPKPKTFSLRLLPLVILTLIAVPAIIFYLLIVKDLPAPGQLASRKINLTTKIYDRNRNLLFKIYKDENRSLISLDQIPLSLQNATIAVEDKDFYSHSGISLKSLLRASLHNLKSFLDCRFQPATATPCSPSYQGGSTITQQLVKNALLSPERTVTRKFKEIVLALKIERSFTKNQILEMYLNEVNYGGTTFGVEEASQLYFSKSAKDLKVAESALLASLPASPTTYSPYGSRPDLALQRQKEVLSLMLQNDLLTQTEYADALKTPLVIQPAKNEIKAPHFVMYVRSLLAQKYGEDMVERGGLEVITSLDLPVQTMAQQIVSQEASYLERLHVTNAAALITKPQTGEIIAMVGSKDYFDTKNQGNFNVTTALRQPGSSIKPVMYSLALESGYTPATTIEDSPVTYTVPGQPPYTPRNYDSRYHGKVTLRTALASSYNIPAVKTLASLGVNRMIEQGRKLGITTWVDPASYGLSLTLGGGEVKMVDMAVAYGTIANLGYRVDLHPFLKISDSKGSILEQYSCQEQAHPLKLIVEKTQAASTSPPVCPMSQTINPAVAYQLVDILSDNSARAPAFGAHSTLVIPGKKVAVKTGTTNNLKDNWTIGFTPDYLVATWVGNNDNSPMSYVASGVTGASPIWQKIIYQLVKDLPDASFPHPNNLVKVEICPLTGTLYCSECPKRQVEYFIPGTQPKNACTPDQVNRLLSPSPTPPPVNP